MSDLIQQPVVLTPRIMAARLELLGGGGDLLRLLPGHQGGAPQPDRGAEVRVVNVLEAVRSSGAEIWSHKLRSALTLVGIVLGTTSARGHGVRDRRGWRWP